MNNFHIKAKLLLLGINLKPIPKYGELMTIKQYIKRYKIFEKAMSTDSKYKFFHGLFGVRLLSCYYAFKNQISDKMVEIQDIKNNTFDKNFTHIVWINNGR